VQESPIDYEAGITTAAYRCGLKNKLKALIGWGKIPSECDKTDLIITPMVKQTAIEPRRWVLLDKNFTSIRN